MIELIAKAIGLIIDSPFGEARPFSKERLDEAGMGALKLFAANGLKPENIVLRTTDVLFGYELNFSLFSGSATFKLSSANLLLNFQNISLQQELELVSDAVVKAYSLFEESAFSHHSANMVAHLSFVDEKQRQGASLSLQDPSRDIEFLGRLAHLKISDWPWSIRLEIDQSNFFPPGLFMSWMSTWQGRVDTTTLRAVVQAFLVAATRFEFNIQIPREQRI